MEKKSPAKKPFCTSCGILFREYSKSTGIHGVSYIGEKRTYFEKIWWLIVFAIALSSCVYAILEVYQKWIRSPVIVTFATQETPIYSIPFPAVTICPESKTNQSLYNHTKVVRKLVDKKSLTEDEQNILNYISLVCDTQHAAKGKFIDENIYKVLAKVNCKSPLNRCSYMGQSVDCRAVFDPIITDDGICYSFNILDKSDLFKDIVVSNSNFHNANKTNNDWTIETGYAEHLDKHTYPRRALFAGLQNGLSIDFRSTTEDIDASCKLGVQGYKVPDNEIVIAGVTPTMITTSNTLKSYDVARRNCYFSYEKELHFFKIYTIRNCKIECLTNFTLYYCGCVGFYMPRENGTKICGIEKQRCMTNAADKLHILNLPDFSSKNKTKKHKFHGNFTVCDCLPMCSDLSYNVELSQSKWNWHPAYRALVRNEKFLDPSSITLSKLTIFFKTTDFIFSERNELYGPLDFLANFGGLLGLFTGFSLLSMMEIVYFLTIRICCNVRLFGQWSGNDN
ncbi:pickpocket protein 28-like isoform X2 [Diabrotica virgifera virgifera]|uniref:Pickpocket protein 28-like n=1 Tax=Diabrotica virgifera virgifera TaxID=50390 RepID=A0ABM5KH96_DIAVI|nr:pickpocket protein 28-like isoform X2 [Diabrotica virgifera virgifera]